MTPEQIREFLMQSALWLYGEAAAKDVATWSDARCAATYQSIIDLVGFNKTVSTAEAERIRAL